MSEDKKYYKEALKALRTRMGGPNKDVAQQSKEHRQFAKKVKEAIKDGLQTVPEISEKIGYPAHEVLYMINTLRKYDDVEIIDKRSEYPKYDLKEGENKDE